MRVLGSNIAAWDHWVQPFGINLEEMEGDMDFINNMRCIRSNQVTNQPTVMNFVTQPFLQGSRLYRYTCTRF